jgi:quercetin dioxygenase-like cupin family protein
VKGVADMEVVRISEIQTFTTPMGFTARKLLDQPSFLIMNLLLKPGDTVEKHVMPDDAFFYVLKGGGKIMIGEEETSVGETDIVFSPKNTPRGLQALPGKEFHVIIVRSPISAE